MKYLYMGIGLLVAVLATSLICLFLLQDYIRETTAYFDRALVELDQGQIEQAIAQAEKAEATWKRHSGFLNAILDHSETDAINWELAEIRSFAKTEDYSEFRAGCEQTAAMMRHIAQMEMPYYENLL